MDDVGDAISGFFGDIGMKNSLEWRKVMKQNQYIYIGFNEEGQKVFWDDTKNQLVEGDKNANYNSNPSKKSLIVYLVGCLMLLITYMTDMKQVGIGIGLVISSIEGILFAAISVYYTRKINTLFFKTAQVYKVKSKDEWIGMLKSGKSMIWTIVGIRMMMGLSAIFIAFLAMGTAESILLIFNVLIWWGFAYFLMNISLIRMAKIHKYLRTNHTI